MAPAGEEAALPDDILIREFISCHYPDATYTLLTGPAKKEIPLYLKKTSANDMVVLGAYARGAVSRWFKTSLADILMECSVVPLFIAHDRS